MITVVGSYKGGSGKSTVSFNLSLWLLNAGRSVIACDLDPQCTLTDAAEVRREEGFPPKLEVRQTLSKKIERDADEIVIDVGTADIQAMKEAISAAQRVVVPVGPSQADIWSTQRFLYLIASVHRKKPLEVLSFINRADTHVTVRESDEAEMVLEELPGLKVLRTRLSLRTAFRRSFSEGLAVCEMEPGGKAAFEFNRLAKALYPEIKPPKC